MYKGQAFLIVTVFIILFILGIKDIIIKQPKYNLYVVDEMKVENVVNELENFIPRYFDEKDLMVKLSEFENFVTEDDNEIEIISLVLNKTNDKMYVTLLKNSFYPINVSLYVDDENIISGEFKSNYNNVFNVSQGNVSVVVKIIYNNVDYSDEFYLFDGDISHFIVVSKRISEEEIIVKHSNKVYSGMFSEEGSSSRPITILPIPSDIFLSS